MNKTGVDFKTGLVLKDSMICAAIAWLIVILLSMIGSVFIHNEYLGYDMISLIAPFLNFIAMLFAISVSGSIRRSGNIWGCICPIVLYVLTQLVVSMLIFDSIGNNIVPVTLYSALGALLALYIEIQRNKHRKSGRRKVHSR